MNKTKILGLLLLLMSVNFISCDNDNEPVDPELLIPVVPPTDTCTKPNSLTISNFSGNSVTASWTASGGTAFEIQYGLDGFIPGTGTSVTATGTSATINGLTVTNNYDFYVRTNCGNGAFSEWTGPVGVGTSVVTCASPANFTVLRSATDATKANATWNASGGEASWDIQYGNTGFAIGSGTTVNVTGTPSKTITGLLATSGYDFYLRSNCSATEHSSWLGPVHISEVGGSSVTYAFMTANIKGTQYNAMKPYFYPFSGTAADLENVDTGGRRLWIQGDTDPLATVNLGIEINLRIHENFWHVGTYPLVSFDTGVEPAVTVNLIDSSNDSPDLILENELPGTLTILEFNSATRRIRGTFSFTYMESGDTQTTGPYNVMNGTFDYEVPAEAF